MNVTRGTLAALAAVQFCALVFAGWAFVTAHSTANKRRIEARNAIVLVARANCGELALARTASLSNTKDVAQKVAIRAFYAELEKPINDALSNLGAQPCEKGTP